jgi:Dyp-type peroxidase family
MRRELIVKTRSLAGSSDVTLLAPIKPGLIPSLESVTYTTRARRVLGALTTGRTSTHESSLLRAFADAVERVGKIHSVRIAVIERDEAKGDPPDEPDKILLAVTFDGGTESYVRVLWQKVGILLDVIFCNTVGYVTAWDHTFDEWAGWIRSVQIETDFFYGMSGLTFDDVQYLRKQEWVHRKRPGKVPPDPLPPNEIPAELEATRETVKSAEELSWSQIGSRPDVIKELGRQGIRALVLLYRLTAYYLPGTTDGALLHRAARELLQEFIRLARDHSLDQVIAEGRKRFDEQITWVLTPFAGRKIPSLPDKEKPEPDDPRDVQGGVISAYPKAITHGCLLLVAFRSFEGGGRFLELLAEKVARYRPKLNLDKQPFVNVHLTYEGFRALGLSETQLAFFPQEFREGMEARASVLGDFRGNHPRRWRLPVRNVFKDEARQTVELSSVHAILQVRAVGEDLLNRTLEELLDAHRDQVDFLSIQPMLRHLNEQGNIREHFGFADGVSDPVLDPKDNGKIYDRNQVQLGEILVGYDNEADFAEDPAMSRDPRLARERLGLLRNGSFLVMRKLAQDVHGLNEAINEAASATRLDAELILAKMMGRRKNGEALAADKAGNDFDYSREVPPGSWCPFHAHIRRANPRAKDNRDLPPLPGRRTPRLMRRGMSYGPVYDPIRDPGTVNEPRGLVFMAYNSSIAEQFEVVQRWISGGNSSGGFSGQSDPFLGVPPIGERKRFRFEHAAGVYQVELDGPDDLLQDPPPFVRLEWGIYLFTPSISALKKLAVIALEHIDVNEEQVWSVEDGRNRIEELLALEKENVEKARDGWKAVLEDPEAQRTFRSAGVWAAIRRHHGGVLRTPYGVIVADRSLVQKVLTNEGGLCSVSGYHERMLKSLGEIYLGLDDHGKGCPYRNQSDKVNEAISELTQAKAFEKAREAAADKIQKLVDNEQRLAEETGESTWELNLGVKEVVDHALAALCREWFGLPEKSDEVEAGGSRWDWKPGDSVLYPGHFTAPSRYFFQPWPGDSAEEYGIRHGEALRRSFAALVKRHRDDPAKKPVLDAAKPLTAVILKAFERRDPAGDPEADDLAGRTMAGAMMGFLPTLDGNLRLSLNEWLRDGTFWSLRGALKDRVDQDPLAALRTAQELLEQPLRKAMQLRPSPEVVWRTVTRDGKIGAVPVRTGDKVVISLVSATQQSRAASWPGDEADVYPIFGGNRREDPHPTHACPGYESAMGALLGVIYALLERKESMRPSPAPLALTLDGKIDGAKVRAPQPALEAPTGEPDREARTPPSQTVAGAAPSVSTGQGADRKVDLPDHFGRGHVLVAAGDSWLTYYSTVDIGRQNIVERLKEDPYNFTVDNLAKLGLRLYNFYTNENANVPRTATKDEARSKRLDDLVSTVQEYVARGTPPAAILFSAAGNDVVSERLTPLLNEAAANSKPEDALIDDLVKEQVEGLMKTWLTAVLTRLKKDCVTSDGTPIRVFIHGYGFPVPDARYLFRGQPAPGLSWLYSSFKEKKWEQATHPAYPANGTPVMNELIAALNKMQIEVVKQFPGHAFHVDLRTTLKSGEQDYQRYWENELHPTGKGFTEVAKKFAESLFTNVPILRGGS